MKYINIIGLILIVITLTIGNRIAPGRYCAYYNNDTIWALGPTNGDENAKNGFWVFFDKQYPSNNLTLSSIGNYKKDKLHGWVIQFDGDSLLSKYSEQYFLNDTLNGEVRFFNKSGKCNLLMHYSRGEMIDRHYLIPEDYTTFEFLNNVKPEMLDSTFIDEIVGMGEKYDPCITILTTPTPDDRIVIFNSWTNIINYICVAICGILLILNIINFKKNRKMNKTYKYLLNQ